MKKEYTQISIEMLLLVSQDIITNSVELASDPHGDGLELEWREA